MKIISFGETSAPLLAGAKTMTWRDWKPKYAASFEAGELVQAWDHLPRAHGHRIALIRLTAFPEETWSNLLPDTDYAAEGLAWMAEHPECWPKTLRGDRFDPHLVTRAGFDEWRETDELGFVVRFELVRVTA